MADKETLGVVISLDDKGFTEGVKKAKETTDGLAKSAQGLGPAISSAEKNMGSASSVIQGVSSKLKEAI